MSTPEQVEAVTGMVLAVGDCIRALGSVPNGELYARLMPMPFMTFEIYTRIIATLKGAGVVHEKNHLLTWVGPKEKR